MTPVRLEPAALRSRVKHSTTEPLPSLLIRVVDIDLVLMVICHLIKCSCQKLLSHTVLFLEDWLKKKVYVDTNLSHILCCNEWHNLISFDVYDEIFL